MKIVNGGRPCDDVSTVKEIGLNYCSRVICAAKGYTPEVESGSKPASGFESQLLIKLDGSKSVHVPYTLTTTWRQLKISIHVELVWGRNGVETGEHRPYGLRHPAERQHRG